MCETGRLPFHSVHSFFSVDFCDFSCKNLPSLDFILRRGNKPLNSVGVDSEPVRIVKYALEKGGRIAVVFLSNPYNRSRIMRRTSGHSYEDNL